MWYSLHELPVPFAHLKQFQDLLISVVSLDESSFAQLVRKPKEEMWLVDFYAPWCAPCHKLTPQWHTLAKQVKKRVQLFVNF